ncbi:MAG: holo-ACP synthase [Proteobacteria bacterium]|nr:holo-ACP synthase [Pseudomonadota bacterium]
MDIKPQHPHLGKGGEIIGIGVDMIRIDRIDRSIARFGDRFLRRIYTANELDQANKRGAGRVRFLATRFAAKEAVWKAMGNITDIASHGLELRQIEISGDSTGKPHVVLNIANTAHMQHWRIDCSLSDDDGLALAFIVISRHYA